MKKTFGLKHLLLAIAILLLLGFVTPTSIRYYYNSSLERGTEYCAARLKNKKQPLDNLLHLTDSLKGNNDNFYLSANGKTHQIELLGVDANTKQIFEKSEQQLERQMFALDIRAMEYENGNVSLLFEVFTDREKELWLSKTKEGEKVNGLWQKSLNNRWSVVQKRPIKEKYLKSKTN